jgi:hypothetical protein
MSQEIKEIFKELTETVIKLDEAINEFCSLVDSDNIDSSHEYFSHYSYLINQRKKLDAEIYQIRLVLLDSI